MAFLNTFWAAIFEHTFEHILMDVEQNGDLGTIMLFIAQCVLKYTLYDTFHYPVLYKVIL